MIVTLGLVFIGEHLFRNLDGVTVGNLGTSVDASVELFGLDFANLTIGVRSTR